MNFLSKSLVLLALLAAAPFAVLSPFVTHIGVMIGIYTTLALSMNLMLRIGQISFAHGAFMGLGAYGSALMMMRLDLPFAVAFFAAALGVTLLAWFVGVLFLRIRGVYFVLLTFAFGEIIVLTFVEWVSLFGGSGGLPGVPSPSLFGYAISGREAFYLLSLALAAFAYASVRAIYGTELGGVITSLDENEALTRSLGIDSRRYRLLTFCFSAFLAGMAGALYGHYLTLVTPEDYGFWVPVNLVMMNVIGGIAHPIGSVLGALLLVPLPELLRDAKQYQMLLYGIVLIFFLLFMPDGVHGLINKLKGRLTGREISR
ncbi:MAG: branched-chain amino acid ABC transporter permease [Gemmatimonadales bacterium]|nr:branched-chain amino acid ABC transporter permease [Gemmatimonadales bacterium]